MSFAVKFILVKVTLFPSIEQDGLEDMVDELDKVGHSIPIFSYAGSTIRIIADEVSVSYNSTTIS